MRRRQFITLIGGATVLWPLGSRGQQVDRIRQVGVLMTLAENDAEGQKYVLAFIQGLRESGWRENDNIRIVYRWAGDDIEHIRKAAGDLVELRPDTILAQTALAMAPLRQMTSTIPIVFVQLADPVASGFVASLGRPGGNITGFSLTEFSMSGKMLEVLKELAPQVRHVTVIYNPAQVPQVGMWRAIEAAGPSLGVRVSAAEADNADEITHIIENSAAEPGSGMIVLPNPITNSNRSLIITLMAKYHLPAAYQIPVYVREGGLVSYGVDPLTQFHQAASYVDRILKGTSPGDLPVQQATNFDLAVNPSTAKALGLVIPQSFLLRADEVIE
jgi:putative tryptophan/tyrosine transport system substrate-binding protein